MRLEFEEGELELIEGLYMISVSSDAFYLNSRNVGRRRRILVRNIAEKKNIPPTPTFVILVEREDTKLTAINNPRCSVYIERGEERIIPPRANYYAIDEMLWKTPYQPLLPYFFGEKLQNEDEICVEGYNFTRRFVFKE
jgi:hypothetical protein